MERGAGAGHGSDCARLLVDGCGVGQQHAVAAGDGREGERGRADTFGSLLLGLSDGGALRYIGSVGTGFTGADLRAIRAALDEMASTTSPFHPDAGLPAGAVLVEPGLVALVAFKEWTRAGKLRAPSFKGFTDDAWQDVTWTAEGPPVR